MYQDNLERIYTKSSLWGKSICSFLKQCKTRSNTLTKNKVSEGVLCYIYYFMLRGLMGKDCQLHHSLIFKENSKLTVLTEEEH